MNRPVEKRQAENSFSKKQIATFLLLFVLCFFAAERPHAQGTEKPVASSNVLTGLSFLPNGTKLRVVLDTQKPVKSVSKMLTAPNRLVIDLKNTQLKLKRSKALGRPGFVKTISHGTTAAGALRIVLEMSKPFLTKNTFSLPARPGEGANRLVIDLEAVSQKEMGINLARKAEQERLKIVRAAEEKAKREAKKQLPKGRRKWRVVLDPGHGGKDGGAKTVKGVLEKEIVLDFAKRLKSELEKSDLFEVILTRNEDKFLRLVERVTIAREAKADLFISIHADSLPKDRRVRGTAVYTISEKASDKLAAELADEQNKVDLIAGYDLKNAPDGVGTILFDLTRQQTSNLSSLFARHFVSDLKGKITFFKFPVQRAAFTVLRIPEIPSALIELGFLSNTKDAEQLSSEKWRVKTAKFMAKSIISYFAKPFLAREAEETQPDG